MNNQIMKVKIGNFGVIVIGHQTKMGDVSQIMEMGNNHRKTKGLEELTLDQILKKQSLWEFIISRNNQIALDRDNSNSDESSELKIPIQSDYSNLNFFKTNAGLIQYSKLMKKYPKLIKSRRGRYGGTQAEIYILLKIASMLDKDLEVEIYRVFIEKQILVWRDVGGENFKELNEIIDLLPDRLNRKESGYFYHNFEYYS